MRIYTDKYHVTFNMSELMPEDGRPRVTTYTALSAFRRSTKAALKTRSLPLRTLKIAKTCDTRTSNRRRVKNVIHLYAT